MKKNSNSNSGRDVQSLIEAIKSSGVVENRVELLDELGELDLTEKSQVASLIESLQFLGLGAKAAVWGKKHLQMTLMSTQDSPEEEHSSLFYQLLLDLLGYSTSIFAALTRYPTAVDKGLMSIIENFILEELNLTKDCILAVKAISSLGSDIQKIALEVLDALIRLCKVYSHGINWDAYLKMIEERKVLDNEEAECVDHVSKIVKFTVEKLCELGILAANDGGNLVSLINLSWKGVVNLLQLGKGSLAVKLNVGDIILTLISLANGSLRCAAETWSSPLKEAVSAMEARRVFLPVKFYLINAVRIISQYPSEAFCVFKDIILSVIMISTFRIFLIKDELLKFAGDAISEILEPTSFHMLNSFLNSTQVKSEQKFQILEWLFGDETYSDNVPLGCKINEASSMSAIFSVSSGTMHGAKILFIGRVAVFVNLLKNSPDIEDDARLGMARKLGWLLCTFTDKDVYSSILVLELPTMSRPSQKQESDEPLYHFIINALKTFMIVTSSSQAWGEIESFLLENLFHPHFLCQEIVTELWCFISRHADKVVVDDMIEKFCSLMKYTEAPDVALNPHSLVRKMARFLCVLVTCGPNSMVDKVYNTVVGYNTSHHSSITYLALLMEGFPLNALSEKLRSEAKQQIVTQYFNFLESFGGKLPIEGGSAVYGAPVFALSAALQFRLISISDAEMKTIKFLVAIIHKYRDCSDIKIRDKYRRLLSETLGIISNMKHSYTANELEEVILSLQNLFISGPALSDGKSFQCKPNLSSFMAGLGNIELDDREDNAVSSAVWELYHMLLREQHWALVHLAITAFGYFAAHSNCNHLWRYVPPDAALSFDLATGKEADEDRFMSELKAFLEKETACPKIRPCPNTVNMFAIDGQMLKETFKKIKDVDPKLMVSDPMEIDNEKQPNRKRKFPDRVTKGVELLRDGVKVMGAALSEWQHNQFDSTDIRDKFLTHFFQLEDVVTHLASLADSG
ncbi:self-incompatibility family protein [Capsicum annuum]|nr:self-incompatibility family protein [Capsicum annuum]